MRGYVCGFGAPIGSLAQCLVDVKWKNAKQRQQSVRYRVAESVAFRLQAAFLILVRETLAACCQRTCSLTASKFRALKIPNFAPAIHDSVASRHANVSLP